MDTARKGEMMKKQIANLLTLLRLFGSILLLFLPVYSLWFRITYLLCGFSDMVDGTVARMTRSSSAFGAKLDSLADTLFVGASFLKFLPVIALPGWIWFWIAAITIIKCSSILLGFAIQKTFVSHHTILNKITGALLFFLPFTLNVIKLEYTAAVVCVLATCAALQEGYFIRKTNEISRAS